MSVEQILRNNDLNFTIVRLGEIELSEPLTYTGLEKLNQELKSVGFEILDDQRKQQIEQIKSILIQEVQSGSIEEHFTISKFITSKVNKDYSHLSRLFTEVEGITIEQFFIFLKIEKAKEWLVYDQYNTNDIAFNLGYSSVQHFSAQFKKITGMTPTQFKKIGSSHRRSIDTL
jgi:AraC-like DNA-binding protein